MNTKKVLLSIGTVLGYMVIVVGFAMTVCLLGSLLTQ
jgi:hypothetical protein